MVIRGPRHLGLHERLLSDHPVGYVGRLRGQHETFMHVWPAVDWELPIPGPT